VGNEFIVDGSQAKAKQLVKEVVHKVEEKGLLLLSCGTYDNILRWIPPLNVSSEQINAGLNIFGESLKESV
ncbi:MAG: 4-aminobutyrate--2-oxoglutarate transaminase, partial [Chloroflexota bacterium]